MKSGMIKPVLGALILLVFIIVLVWWLLQAKGCQSEPPAPSLESTAQTLPNEAAPELEVPSSETPPADAPEKSEFSGVKDPALLIADITKVLSEHEAESLLAELETLGLSAEDAQQIQQFVSANQSLISPRERLVNSILISMPDGPWSQESENSLSISSNHLKETGS